MYPKESPYHNMEELEEIIKDRICYHNNFKNEKLVASSFTQDAAQIAPDFLNKYDLADKLKNLYVYNINSFTQIGLEDPWPDDEDIVKGSLDDIDPAVYTMPVKVTDLVYKKSRYESSVESPTQVYIPRKEIMLKLMRACVSC